MSSVMYNTTAQQNEQPSVVAPEQTYVAAPPCRATGGSVTARLPATGAGLCITQLMPGGPTTARRSWRRPSSTPNGRRGAPRARRPARHAAAPRPLATGAWIMYNTTHHAGRQTDHRPEGHTHRGPPGSETALRPRRPSSTRGRGPLRSASSVRRRVGSVSRWYGPHAGGQETSADTGGARDVQPSVRRSGPHTCAAKRTNPNQAPTVTFPSTLLVRRRTRRQQDG